MVPEKGIRTAALPPGGDGKPAIQLPDRTTSTSKPSGRSAFAATAAANTNVNAALSGATDKMRAASLPTTNLSAQDMSRSSSNSSENFVPRGTQTPHYTKHGSETQLPEKPSSTNKDKAERTPLSRSINRLVQAPNSLRKIKAPPILQKPAADVEIVSKVDSAPPSGMYWSKAPSYDRGSPPLRAHTASLVGSNIFVFGGCDPKSCFNDLYIFDADSMFWSQPECTGEKPPPLRAMTTTTVGKKLIIFGGGDGPTYYNDVYVFDTIGYRYLKPKISGTPPSKRRAHTACLYKNGLYVFGGGDGVRALNDVWRLDVADVNRMSWKLISESSAAGVKTNKTNGHTTGTGPDGKPTARGYHTANMVGSKLIIFGGSDGVECFRDVWIFDVETEKWKCVDIKVSFPRLSHTSTLVGSYLFVVGGHDGQDYSSEVLLLNLVTMQWDKRKVYGSPPSGRGYHGAVLYDSRLFITGGFDGHTVFDDTYLLELAVSSYYSQISHFSIDV